MNNGIYALLSAEICIVENQIHHGKIINALIIQEPVAADNNPRCVVISGQCRWAASTSCRLAETKGPFRNE